MAKLNTQRARPVEAVTVTKFVANWDGEVGAIVRERWALRDDGKVLCRLISVAVEGENVTTLNDKYKVKGRVRNVEKFDLRRFLKDRGYTVHK
jgi:hypothetical protein